MTSGADDLGDRSVLLVHPGGLVRDALAATFVADDLEVRLADSAGSAAGLLRRRPAMVTVVCDEYAAELGMAALVSGLLDAGSVAVVVLASTPAEPDMIAALEAGALGYVDRDQQLDRLLYDVRGALRGQACLPKDMLGPVLRLLITRRRAQEDQDSKVSQLSRREREVLSHLVGGSTNEEIAQALFLSPATVRTHVQNIFTKLDAHSRLEAASLAVAAGVAAPDHRQAGHAAQS